MMMKFLIINNFISCILIYSLKSSLIPTFKLGLLASFLNINLFNYSKSLHKSKMCVIFQLCGWDVPSSDQVLLVSLPSYFAELHSINESKCAFYSP